MKILNTLESGGEIHYVEFKDSEDGVIKILTLEHFKSRYPNVHVLPKKELQNAN